MITNYLQTIGLSVRKLILLGGFVGLAGFVDSIAGGGGLISLPAYMIVGIPPKIASATNKVSSSCGAVVAFERYARAGFVDFRIAIPCVLMGLIGGNVGAELLNIIDENLFKIMLIVVLPLMLVFVLNKKSFNDKNAIDTKDLSKKTLIKCLVVTYFIGMYDGFYGPGTGTFLIILFTSVAKLKLNDANGIAKTINFATNIGALIMHIHNGKSIILLGLLCGLCSAIGSFFGTKLFKKKGSIVVKPIMVIVLAIFIIKLASELIGVI